MNFQDISPTTLGNLLPGSQFMDIGIRPLWDSPRIAGAAYTVKLAPGQNLMLHAAIYRAPAGAVIVCNAGDLDYAVAGGNVCAVAQERGIAGFVIDGVIRDLADIRRLQFPVFARGVRPIPGGKKALGELQTPVLCGGVTVQPGDLLVADEEGVAVVPHAQAAALLPEAAARQGKEESTPLAAWAENHRRITEQALQDLGFNG